MMEAYGLRRWMPGALPIAFNGGGTFYLFDLRQDPVDGEYPVVSARAGNLGSEPDECVVVSDCFEAACRGWIDVDELHWGKPPSASG